jgi:hypothetical protein
VVGKHDRGVDVERRAGADLPNRIPQRVDLRHQQIRAAVQQVRREEECPTRNPIATIIRHDGSMPGFGGEAEGAALFRPTFPAAASIVSIVVMGSFLTVGGRAVTSSQRLPAPLGVTLDAHGEEAGPRASSATMIMHSI